MELENSLRLASGSLWPFLGQGGPPGSIQAAAVLGFGPIGAGVVPARHAESTKIAYALSIQNCGRPLITLRPASGSAASPFLEEAP